MNSIMPNFALMDLLTAELSTLNDAYKTASTGEDRSTIEIKRRQIVSQLNFILHGKMEHNFIEHDFIDLKTDFVPSISSQDELVEPSKQDDDDLPFLPGR